jgi:phosphomannomutase/phosphoglucomutase
LDCDVISINGPDEGPRPSDWSLTSALEQLGNRVRDEGADLGVLFDSDGDRLHTVTNAGTPVTTDQLLMILARDMLERNPGADIVYDVKFSRNFAPFVTRAGGRAQMSRSGAAFVREKMQQISALLGADFSGHIFFEERWFGFSDAMYALARLLEILAGESHDYEALVANLPKGMTTPEVYVPVDERMRRKIMRGLLENPDFPGAKVTTLDGLRVDYADGWGLVRGSTTDAALNLRFEGNDETSLARVRNVIYKAIHNIEPELKLPG